MLLEEAKVRQHFGIDLQIASSLYAKESDYCCEVPRSLAPRFLVCQRFFKKTSSLVH